MSYEHLYVMRDFDYINAVDNEDDPISSLTTEQRLSYEVRVTDSEDSVAMTVKPEGYTGSPMQIMLDIYNGEPRITIYMQERSDPALYVNISPKNGCKVTIDDNGPLMDDELKEYEAFLENAKRSHQAQDAAQLNPVQEDETDNSKRMKL